MSLRERIPRQIDRLRQLLDLSEKSVYLLELLIRLDIDPDFAHKAQEEDEHQRTGILSWRLIVDLLDPTQPRDITADQAATPLLDWAILEAVGAQPNDPKVAGAAPLRLTWWGRICLGLAPGRVGVAPEGTPDWSRPGSLPHESPRERSHQCPRECPHEPGLEPWTLLHGAGLETLICRARELVGDRALSPVWILPDQDTIDRLCGQVALEALSGAVVVSVPDAPAAGALLRQLLHRTSRARATRLVLVTDITPFRIDALATKARLERVDLSSGSSRPSLVDPRITEELLNRDPARMGNVLEVGGASRSPLAIVRRVNVRLEDLLLSRKVARRLELALEHAKARLAPDGPPWSTSPFAPAGVPRSASPLAPAGYRLLLSGLSGTGKSMAAAALATYLGCGLIKLDLSTVLSKWLGETEKMLDEVFASAEEQGALLLLDEAEALLRQRGDSADRSAGLATTIAYLLTRLDDFRGVLVATTNRVADLDEAFHRRFHDYLVLPLPDLPTRTALWRQKLGDDVGQVDITLLANRFSISGGLIENASYRARAWVLARKTPLTTALVLGSLALEMEKSHLSPSSVLLPGLAGEITQLIDGGEPTI